MSRVSSKEAATFRFMPVTAPGRAKAPRMRTRTIVEILETIPTVVLRLDRWEDLCNTAGLIGPRARAGYVSITPKHVRDIERGDSVVVGNFFIASALTAFGVAFDDLFTIEERPAPSVAAAAEQ